MTFQIKTRKPRKPKIVSSKQFKVKTPSKSLQRKSKRIFRPIFTHTPVFTIKTSTPITRRVNRNNINDNNNDNDSVHNSDENDFEIKMIPENNENDSEHNSDENDLRGNRGNRGNSDENNAINFSFNSRGNRGNRGSTEYPDCDNRGGNNRGNNRGSNDTGSHDTNDDHEYINSISSNDNTMIVDDNNDNTMTVKYFNDKHIPGNLDKKQLEDYFSNLMMSAGVFKFNDVDLDSVVAVFKTYDKTHEKDGKYIMLYIRNTNTHHNDKYICSCIQYVYIYIAFTVSALNLWLISDKFTKI